MTRRGSRSIEDFDSGGRALQECNPSTESTVDCVSIPPGSGPAWAGVFFQELPPQATAQSEKLTVNVGREAAIYKTTGAVSANDQRRRSINRFGIPSLSRVSFGFSLHPAPCPRTNLDVELDWSACALRLSSQATPRAHSPGSYPPGGSISSKIQIHLLLPEGSPPPVWRMPEAQSRWLPHHAGPIVQPNTAYRCAILEGISDAALAWF